MFYKPKDFDWNCLVLEILSSKCISVLFFFLFVKFGTILFHLCIPCTGWLSLWYCHRWFSRCGVEEKQNWRKQDRNSLIEWKTFDRLKPILCTCLFCSCNDLLILAFLADVIYNIVLCGDQRLGFRLLSDNSPLCIYRITHHLLTGLLCAKLMSYSDQTESKWCFVNQRILIGIVLC